jgi:hypothetical protein
MNELIFYFLFVLLGFFINELRLKIKDFLKNNKDRFQGGM